MNLLEFVIKLLAIFGSYVSATLPIAVLTNTEEPNRPRGVLAQERAVGWVEKKIALEEWFQHNFTNDYLRFKTLFFVRCFIRENFLVMFLYDNALEFINLSMRTRLLKRKWETVTFNVRWSRNTFRRGPLTSFELIQTNKQIQIIQNFPYNTV